MKYQFVIFLLVLAALTGCGTRSAKTDRQEESRQAKQLLQGIWMDEDTESIVFKMKGDSVYYPDSTSMPAYFCVVGDTLYIGSTARYHIAKQTANVLWMNRGDYGTVKLVKTDEPEDDEAFLHRDVQVLTLTSVLKRDTVVMHDGNRYHLYVAVNPTRYKVVHHTLNDDGMDVENVYYDNIIHLSIYQGARQLFSKDFRKQQYEQAVPKPFLGQSILNNMEFDHADAQGLHFNVSLCVPDDASCYLVEHVVAYDGTLSTQLQEY